MARWQFGVTHLLLTVFAFAVAFWLGRLTPLMFAGIMTVSAATAAVGPMIVFGILRVLRR
jgi:hypothetical protein